MGSVDLGPWKPMHLDAVVKLFSDADFRWWICGGNALGMHLQRSWRNHEDIGITRADATKIADLLGDWDIHIAASGTLTPWDGGPLSEDLSQNNLRCRPTPNDAWSLDITIGAGTDRHWIYRRDPTIKAAWSDAVLYSSDGTPYLAPELQLLFKSKTIRPKDSVDAATVIPALEPQRLTRLASLLQPDHPWQTIIARATAKENAHD